MIHDLNHFIELDFRKPTGMRVDVHARKLSPHEQVLIDFKHRYGTKLVEINSPGSFGRIRFRA